MRIVGTPVLTQQKEGKKVKRLDEMEYCSIIETVCPYDHACNVCRLHNDYEAARKKAHELIESQERSKG